ncbi:UPF0149 family protein [uncultured Sphingomonas sp.]|uniref:UPF0149 family protein n=1 Tax=uncultured Sphingomonas sp. TaxID=158754 RepID=UPI0035CC0CB4
MKPLPSRFRRLDEALASLPLDEPMLLTELDGFLTGILVCPELIMPAEWLPVVWGSEAMESAPFDDPADLQWFADAVLARYNEIVRDLGRGRLKPIFDTDERNGETLWEFWIDGFAQAMDLRPDEWAALADGNDQDAADALSCLSLLIAVAGGQSELDSVQLDTVHDEAPTDVAELVLRLHAARLRGGVTAHDSAAQSAAQPVKVSRNDPCRCGSGKKSKRCCG